MFLDYSRNVFESLLADIIQVSKVIFQERIIFPYCSEALFIVTIFGLHTSPFFNSGRHNTVSPIKTFYGFTLAFFGLVVQVAEYSETAELRWLRILPGRCIFLKPPAVRRHSKLALALLVFPGQQGFYPLLGYLGFH